MHTSASRLGPDLQENESIEFFSIDASELDAFIFDMDGVLTDTASIHAAAWKRMFDEFMEQRVEVESEQTHPFDSQEDYLRFVDGKPRYDGAQSFLESRNISIPFGSPEDSPDGITVCGLGNRKFAYFSQMLQNGEIRPFERSIKLVHLIKRAGLKVAVITSSKSGPYVLERSGIRNLFDAAVTGNESERLGLKGKPAPDIFIEASKRLGVLPKHAAVMEDSEAGAQAAKNGGFGLVIGVNRADHAHALRNSGAEIVVQDAGQLSITTSTGRNLHD